MMSCRILVTWLTRMKCEKALYGNHFNWMRIGHVSERDVWTSYSLGQYNFFLSPSIFVHWVYSTQCLPRLFKNEQNMSLRILLCFAINPYKSINREWHWASGQCRQLMRGIWGTYISGRVVSNLESYTTTQIWNNLPWSLKVWHQLKFSIKAITDFTYLEKW